MMGGNPGGTSSPLRGEGSGADDLPWNLIPPTGRPTHAKLIGGPHHGKIVTLTGTHAVPAPRFDWESGTFKIEGTYEWVKVANSDQIVGVWQDRPFR